MQRIPRLTLGSRTLSNLTRWSMSNCSSPLQINLSFICRPKNRSLLSYFAVRHYDIADYFKANSDHISGTMDQVSEMIRKRTGVSIGYHVVPKSREHLLKYQPDPKTLPVRCMQDSFTTAILPLSDEIFREHFINHLARLRMGRLMEQLDMFAVWLCHRHILAPDVPEDVAWPFTLVTLLVDRVDFTRTDEVLINKDIELSGFVSWTGRSSMETTIYVRQPQDNGYVNVTKALFLMVARNATNTKSAQINSLKPANEVEERVWKESEERQKKRKATQSRSVFTSAPVEHEQAYMYSMLQRTTPEDSYDLNKRRLPPNSRWMADCRLTTTVNPFPQHRNAHNTVFGGFLMRQAVEISHIMASIYMGGSPVLVCISDISFMKGVKVTSFLQMSANIVYTNQNYMQLMTVAQNWDVSTGKQTETNVFYLTYCANKIVDEVLPGTYREMVWFIHGRRKFYAALNLVPDYPKAAEKVDKSEKKSPATVK